MRNAALALGLTALVGLSSCTDPYDPGQRAVGGAAIGAGTGAAIGAIAGGGRGAGIGALAGGAIGAIGGAATTPQRPPPPNYYQQPGYPPPPPPPPGYGYDPSKRFFFKKRTKNFDESCRGLAGESAAAFAKVFASFFKKKRFLTFKPT